MWLEIVLAAMAVWLIVDGLRLHRQLADAMGDSPRAPSLDRYPAVSVIRPIRGLDVDARMNIESAFRHGYPGRVQTIFVFDDRDEPAYPLVQRVISGLGEELRQDAQIVFSGQPSSRRTGKLNAMIAGLMRAKYDIIVFADSDIRPASGALSALVETLLASPDNGASFAPVVVTSPLRTIGDAGYALMLNGLYGPAAYKTARERHNEMPFIMGQFMALRRETIRAIGGLESLEGQLVDDMYLGVLVNRVGKRNAVSWCPVPVIQYGLRLSEFLGVYRRWIAFSRSGLPSSFGSAKMISIHRALDFWVGLLIAASAALLGHPLVALAGLAVPCVIAWSIGSLHVKLGGAALSSKGFATAFGIVLFAPLIFASNALHRDIDWRGRVYHLDSEAHLAVESVSERHRNSNGSGSAKGPR